MLVVSAINVCSMGKCMHAKVSHRADEKDYHISAVRWFTSNPGIAFKIIPMTHNGQKSENPTNKLCL